MVTWAAAAHHQQLPSGRDLRVAQTASTLDIGVHWV